METITKKVAIGFFWFVWNAIKYFAAPGFNRNWEVLVALYKAI